MQRINSDGFRQLDMMSNGDDHGRMTYSYNKNEGFESGLRGILKTDGGTRIHDGLIPTKGRRTPGPLSNQDDKDKETESGQSGETSNKDEPIIYVPRRRKSSAEYLSSDYMRQPGRRYDY